MLVFVPYAIIAIKKNVNKTEAMLSRACLHIL